MLFLDYANLALNIIQDLFHLNNLLIVWMHITKLSFWNRRYQKKITKSHTNTMTFKKTVFEIFKSKDYKQKKIRTLFNQTLCLVPLSCEQISITFLRCLLFLAPRILPCLAFLGLSCLWCHIFLLELAAWMIYWLTKILWDLSWKKFLFITRLQVWYEIHPLSSQTLTPPVSQLFYSVCSWPRSIWALHKNRIRS